MSVKDYDGDDGNAMMVPVLFSGCLTRPVTSFLLTLFNLKLQKLQNSAKFGTKVRKAEATVGREEEKNTTDVFSYASSSRL